MNQKFETQSDLENADLWVKTRDGNW
jgi:hypothetical protein